MNDSIHADTVARQKREQERMQFLRECIVAAFRAGTITGSHKEIVSASSIVREANSAWIAIEATRESK